MKCHVFQLVLLCFSIMFSFTWAFFLENILLIYRALLYPKSVKNAHFFAACFFCAYVCTLYQKFKQKFFWHNNYADVKIFVLDLYNCCWVWIFFFLFIVAVSKSMLTLSTMPRDRCSPVCKVCMLTCSPETLVLWLPYGVMLGNLLSKMILIILKSCF